MAHILNQLGVTSSTQRAQLSAAYQKCGIPKTLFIWLQENIGRYMKRREQIRVLSVFSVDPDSEVFLVKTFTSQSFRVRYCIVLAERKNRFDQAIRGTLYSQSVQMELCDKYTDVKQVRERFDLVIMQELPHNEQVAFHVISNIMTKLREGGNLVIAVRNDGQLSQIQRDIFLKYAPSHNLLLASQLKEILDHHEICYESFEAKIPFRIPDGVDCAMLFTVLFGIDITLIPQEELDNYVHLLANFNDTMTIFDIPCGSNHAKNLLNIKNGVDIPKSQWFPEGRFGPFINIGKEAWGKFRADWVKHKPHNPVSVPEQSGLTFNITDIISARNQYKFSKYIKLNDFLPQLADYWKQNPE